MNLFCHRDPFYKVTEIKNSGFSKDFPTSTWEKNFSLCSGLA
ncbi:hypothetical protein CCA_00294 [Chlamydia caviae GPIC]|uniref:Uncharacterized protein n=1 Tax=Chlamydia caviae (strain ATCC VR-813 / DSM 19441 / 03DC25 / GPIC) TaxID=227941 RepID=Q823W1_CHLCV|nr:hypothetical protein CCA_00294 [Chlamydia caviae GPIC]